MFSLPAKCRVNKRFSSSKRVPKGLTRLEVLLVLSVILLNFAIFLPFVQHTREAARRNQCKNNLKQIGLAVANYQDAYSSYPAGFDVNPEGNYLGWGWSLKILPYMNDAEVFQKIEPHFAEGIHGLPNVPEFNRRLPSLWCPSETGTETVPHALVVTAKVVDGSVSAGTKDWQSRFPQSNYFGNAGYLQLDAGAASVLTHVELHCDGLPGRQ